MTTETLITKQQALIEQYKLMLDLYTERNNKIANYLEAANTLLHSEHEDSREKAMIHIEKIIGHLREKKWDQTLRLVSFVKKL